MAANETSPYAHAHSHACVHFPGPSLLRLGYERPERRYFRAKGEGREKVKELKRKRGRTDIIAKPIPAAARERKGNESVIDLVDYIFITEEMSLIKCRNEFNLKNVKWGFLTNLF
ncbi:hypothetical protein PUN28_015523 [Cardiocondyla obscurior]|uniref:Uncharacterized protein n=1 Tax=Cardiocondyla obscurior TaxID=286306 RepID=A0AAW2EZH1_9HYME